MADHTAVTTDEFTRQAAHYAAAPALANASLTERIVAAVGANGAGTVLDLACGPGILTAALAPGAKAVTAFDLTAEMLRLAEERCTAAGLTNVSYRQGNAEQLPFAEASFDCVVTRLTIHHFTDPAAVVAEIHRVLRPGGTFVLADVVSADDAGEAALHNAIEILRDPSHVRMLPAAELAALVAGAGFAITDRSRWDQPRTFDEWAKIVADPARVGPLKTVVGALADAGMTAGIGLARGDGDIAFTHHWLLLTAERLS